MSPWANVVSPVPPRVTGTVPVRLSSPRHVPLNATHPADRSMPWAKVEEAVVPWTARLPEVVALPEPLMEKSVVEALSAISNTRAFAVVDAHIVRSA